MSEEKKKVVVKAVKPKKITVKTSTPKVSTEKVEEQPVKSVFEEPKQKAASEPVQMAVKEPAPTSEKKKPAVYNQWWFWLVLAAAILGIVALATRGGVANNAGDSNSAVAADATTKNADSISVDENLITVEVTMPAAFFEDETPEEIQANAKEQGVISCTINDDGSVTYKMTKAKRREMLNGFKKSIDDTIQDYTSGGENAPSSYKSISYNSKVTQFDVRVDRAAYENSFFDSLYVMSFYMLGGYYQIFDGVPEDQVNVIVNYIDDSTGEIIETGSYQDAMENANA